MTGDRKAPPIKSHVSFVLRQAGHKVGRIIRVHAPGDPGAYDGMVTAEYVDSQQEPMTAVLWAEDKSVKAGVKISVEKVRVYNGWQGFRGWEDPDD